MMLDNSMLRLDHPSLSTLRDWITPVCPPSEIGSPQYVHPLRLDHLSLHTLLDWITSVCTPSLIGSPQSAHP